MPRLDGALAIFSATNYWQVSKSRRYANTRLLVRAMFLANLSKSLGNHPSGLKVSIQTNSIQKSESLIRLPRAPHRH